MKTAKIKVLHSCIGHEGEHLEAGDVYDQPDDVAATLVRMGRAVAVEAEEEEKPKRAKKQAGEDDGL